MSKIVVAGVVLFLGVVLALPALKGDGYSALEDSISEGAIGRYGLLQTAAFLVLGASSLALVRIVAAHVPGRRGRAAAVLIAVWAVGVLLCGVFEVDEGAEGATTSSKVHLAAALVAFVAALAAVWLVTTALRGDPDRRQAFSWSLPAAVAISAAFLAAGAAPADSAWDGLAQRLFIALLLGWMAALAVTLTSGRGRRSAAAG